MACFLMGAVANLPLAVAPGMGEVLSQHISDRRGTCMPHAAAVELNQCRAARACLYLCSVLDWGWLHLVHFGGGQQLPSTSPPIGTSVHQPCGDQLCAPHGAAEHTICGVTAANKACDSDIYLLLLLQASMRTLRTRWWATWAQARYAVAAMLWPLYTGVHLVVISEPTGKVCRVGDQQSMVSSAGSTCCG
jgi:hypothetical protein